MLINGLICVTIVHIHKHGCKVKIFSVHGKVMMRVWQENQIYC